MTAREAEDPGVSIDDLLGHDEDEPASDAPRRGSSRWGRWAGHGLFVAALTAATVAGLRVAGLRVSPVLVVAGVVALRVLQTLVAAVAAPPAPRAADRAVPRTEDGLYKWQSGDALRGAVRRWENRLAWTHTDAAKFSRNVLPVLAELTDERLRQRHGITRASDPRRARELLGEPLWRTLTEPGRRPPKARDVAEYVTALEKL